jgi:YVTN family beta-propeller protein
MQRLRLSGYTRPPPFRNTLAGGHRHTHGRGKTAWHLAYFRSFDDNGPAAKLSTSRCRVSLHRALAVASFSLFALSIAKVSTSRPHSSGVLVVANQKEHTVLLVDPEARRELAKISVGINGHEVAVSPDSRFAYVPIYGNSGVGRPGTDGATIDIIDLQQRKLAATMDLGKPLRPHLPAFGPDGLLYVSAELANAVDIIDTASRKVIAEAPTGQPESHMFVLSKDGRRAYTANVHAGTVSVVDIANRKLITTIPVAKTVQRISISPDGAHVFTHDQDAPRIAVIDTATNKVTNWIDIPDSAYASEPTPDGRFLLAVLPSANRTVAVDLKTLKVAKSFDVPQQPGEVLIRPDAAVAYITCMPAGKIAVLDLRTWQLQPNIDLTPGIDGMAWSAK